MDCPADCPFYPFGVKGYDLWLKLDENWGPKAINYVRRHFGEERFDQLLRASHASRQAEMEDTVLAHSHALYSALFFLRDAAGQTVSDQWEAEGWTGLNNDERVMMRYRRQSLVTVVEVQKVLDYQSARCLDVLSPASPPFLLLDRTSTAQMLRFTRLLAWVTHYPHFSRLGGIGIVVDLSLWPFWKEMIEHRLAREQAQQPGLTLQEMLARNFIWAIDKLTELGLEYRQRLFANVDLFQCVANYRLMGSIQAVATILNSRPDFEPQNPRTDLGFAKPLAQFAWLRRGESAEFNQSMAGPFRHPSPSESVGSMGNVRLYADQLIIEVFSKKKYAFARQMIDRFFGPLLQFQKESIVDLAQMQMRKYPIPKVSQEVVEMLDRAFSEGQHHLEMDSMQEFSSSPELDISIRNDEPGPPPDPQVLVERMLQRHYRSMLEDRIPMLDGHTPRECARDPALRPQLIEWTKGHIHNVENDNRQKGTRLNLDWFLDELGLTELK